MREIIASCVALIAALWAVGLVAAEPVRHLVQAVPIWIGVVLGARKMPVAKWAALPFFIFWLCLMILIWLYLLGWARVVSGTFSPVEIVLTFIIGTVSLHGIVSCLRFKSTTRVASGVAAFAFSAALQWTALQVSLIPAIARR